MLTLRAMTCCLLAVLLPVLDAHAEECLPTTQLAGLVLGDTADVNGYGEYVFGTRAAQGMEGAAYDLVHLDARFGFDERFQLQGDFDQKRLQDGGLDHAFTAGVGYQMLCGSSAPKLRLDFGFHHDGGNGPDFGFVTGQGVRHFSWQFGVHRSTAVRTTRYNAALIFGERLVPLVLEAAAADTGTGWDRWFSWAVYPVSNDALELGFAMLDGGGVSEGERHLVLRLTSRF